MSESTYTQTVNTGHWIGRLGANPELKVLDGKRVAKFSIAVDSLKKAGEAFTKKANWFKVELWNEAADIVMKHFSKGDLVYLEGSITKDTWKDERFREAINTKVLPGVAAAWGGGEAGAQAMNMVTEIMKQIDWTFNNISYVIHPNTFKVLDKKASQTAYAPAAGAPALPATGAPAPPTTGVPAAPVAAHTVAGV